MNIKFLISIILFVILFFPKSALAVDLTVTCSSSGCSASSSPLFSEANVYPGWSTTKVVTAVNNYSDTAKFATQTSNFSSINNLSDVLILSIKKTGDVNNIYEDNLTNFNNHGYLVLGNIDAGLSQNYDFSVRMLTAADNKYQGLTTKFDLSLGFELLPAPSASPQASPAPSASPGCQATAPGPVSNLSANAGGTTVINLSWSAASGTVTHYGISYGTSPGSYSYGALNIGNVLSYAVSDLSSGTPYYFVVYAYNDCASSSASNEATATTGGVLGVYIAPGPAPGFQVLGITTDNGKVNGVAAPQIEGVSVSCPLWKKWWWWPLLVQAIFSFVYYQFLKRQRKLKKKLVRYLWTPLLVVAVISQIAHQLIGCSCTFSRFCPYYWVFDLLIFLFFLHKIKTIRLTTKS